MSTLGTIIHFINGACVDTKSARYADVFNPALGVPLVRVALGTAQEVDIAVQAAAAAFPGWSNTPPLTRARVLFKYLHLCQQHADEFAVLAEHCQCWREICIASDEVMAQQ